MDRELSIIVIAALLHDIGKFAQRANRPYSKEMKGEYLTNFKGKQGHWHTVYSDYFIEHDLPLPQSFERDRSRIARLASAHHRPAQDSMAEMVLTIADRLSSGTDRIAVEDPEGQAGFRESRLVSVFDEIELVQHEFNPPGSWFYKLEPLEPGSQAIFPCHGAPAGDKEDYAELFERFLAEVPSLKGIEDPKFYIEALVALLEKYTWCIPSSSYKTLSDISLFDHAFSTTGIAQALFMYYKDKGTIPTFGMTDQQFLLVGGDLSGIQQYIFDVAHNGGKGVSKIFRARSFYLQVLTRAILIDMQRTFGLHSACKLLDTGGKFIALFPNIEKLNTQLEQFNHDLQTWFRKKFKGTVTMGFSWSTVLGQEDFKLGKFQSKLDDVNWAIENSKHRKLNKTFSSLGVIIEDGYDQTELGNCALCGINAADGESNRRYNQKEGSDLPICRDCCDQIVYFGTKLPRTNFLVFNESGKVPVYRDIHLTLLEKAPDIKIEHTLHVDALNDVPGFSRFRLARHLPFLSENDLSDEKWFNLFEQDMDSNSPDWNQVPMTFSMIARKSKKPTPEKLIGRELLGFLKADVDNLGLLFSLGLGDRLSVARFSTLSRMLNLFFSEYLVEIVKKRFPYIYVVFAGGDDLFLVGPWWHTIQFALELRRQFSKFCADNGDITLSCGINAARPRLPMRKAAELVENMLDKSKDVDTADRLKNSICFQGEAMAWPELESLMALGVKLDRAVEERDRTNFSTAFLYRLMTYQKMYRSFTQDKDIRAGRYLALAHYDIGRNIKSSKLNNADELSMLYRIFAVGTSERPELSRLNVALFYAINMNREG